MLKHNWLLALRQLVRYRGHNFINIFGLAFGLACCMMCYVHIRYQYSFDTFHANANRLHRLVTGDPATTHSWVKMAAPIPPKLAADIPEIEQFVRFNSVSWNEKVTVAFRDKLFLESSFMMADANFFEVFDFELEKGEASKVLKDLSSVVISQSTALKLFGDEDPLGKIITLKDNNAEFQVTGVMKDLPANTHLRADYIVSFSNLENLFGKGRADAWGEFNYFAYLLLDPSADAAEVQKKIQAVVVDLPGRDDLSFSEFRLQPVIQIHFQHSRGNILPSYDGRYLYIFLTLAASILLVATMNYFNLATMINMRRTKEMGIRKSIGATGQQLARQVIGESFGYVVISLIIGIILLELLRPVGQWALDTPLQIDYADPWFLASIAFMVVLMTALSGIYLAVYVNSFKPGEILKGAFARTSGNPIFQRTLILVQFTISLILLSSAFVVSRQMNYVQRKNLGFDYNGIINVPVGRELTVQQIEVLKNELKKSAHVADVAASDFLPGRANWHQTTWWEGQVEPESMFVIAADKDFVRAMKMELIEGEQAALESANGNQYLINESARDQIGWSAAVGKMISPFGEQSKQPVAGVVRDFNFASLHQAVGPLVLVVFHERKFSQLSVRLAGTDLQAAIDDIEGIHEKVTNGLPFEFNFMDQSIGNLYKSEKQMNGIVLFLALVALVFSLLGIYALISFAIENRTKEIAIRKVLGVSAGNLVRLFSVSYVRLAIVAAVIAVPVSWNLLGEWLTRFDSHVGLSPLWFAVAVALLILSILAIGIGKFWTITQVSPAQSLKQD